MQINILPGNNFTLKWQKFFNLIIPRVGEDLCVHVAGVIRATTLESSLLLSPKVEHSLSSSDSLLN